ncbi:T9SS type A sorting domain-containing protein [Plebeiibacterium marinum]|uniref:T9SS type A sorting domain-containing protein n=1 Tax=Plebeiibacterium marinum TaxID=2992111 RepID=A0AAE3SL69_9BACT|nr:T9SS type A sorting domain-containing protein [Plebeiobacterium marinum]MCW3807590.1 T9SS type A sorting domain-containing protein [Plebeiobacterium marinum]
MRLLFSFCLFWCHLLPGWSQLNEQALMSASGGHVENSNFMISFSIGEIITNTYSSENTELTQGLHQPNLIPTSAKNLKLSELEISVYPNPIIDYVSIYNNETQCSSYKLFTTQGKFILENTLNKTISKVDLSQLNKGSYLLVFYNINNNKLATHKLVKK